MMGCSWSRQDRSSFCVEHLQLRLQPLRRALRIAVQRQASAFEQLLRPDLREKCITTQQVELWLDGLDEEMPGGQFADASIVQTADERTAEDSLRRDAEARGQEATARPDCRRGGLGSV
jgi:hypothetical protein